MQPGDKTAVTHHERAKRSTNIEKTIKVAREDEEA